ncbi:MAG: hypothetical protein WBQ94_14535 [Terracidiphilus sp.]
MIVTPSPDHHTSAMGVEFVLTLLTILAAFAWPRMGDRLFSGIERVFASFAQNRILAVVAIGIPALLLRLAILPVFPIPLPFVPDDFSFLLAADTFAHGRLANPTPAMWTHFESIHITMQPTYMSMYFPAQGLVLAAGKVLFGNPWFGILITSALMCGAICWMLQAWMPVRWALLGGIIAIVHLGLFSYWVNTYHAAGCIGAAGGALILGALPRIMRAPRLRYTCALGAGIAILEITRPYECLLLCLPVSVILVRWLSTGRNRPSARALHRLAAFPLLLVVSAVTWLGYYDYRAFGSPITLPYTINRATYAMAPYYVWQKARPEPAYRHQAMRDYYYKTELEIYNHLHTIPGFFLNTFVKALAAVLFFGGFAFLPLVLMLRRVLLDHRIRILVICVAVLIAGMLIENFLVIHYLAPFTAAFYAIGLQTMRHMRVWRPGGRPVGTALVRLMVTVCLAMVGLRLYTGPFHLQVLEFPPTWNVSWYGPDHFGTERDRVQTSLENLPGKQLAIVRYNSTHVPFNEWVYNTAEIDASKVIWAREMDEASNLELMNYYKDRKAWLVQPDLQPATVTPYRAPGQAAVTIHSDNSPLTAPKPNQVQSSLVGKGTRESE